MLINTIIRQNSVLIECKCKKYILKLELRSVQNR